MRDVRHVIMSSCNTELIHISQSINQCVYFRLKTNKDIDSRIVADKQTSINKQHKNNIQLNPCPSNGFCDVFQQVGYFASWHISSCRVYSDKIPTAITMFWG